MCHVTRWPLMTAHEPGHGSFPSAFKREPVPRAEPALFITPAPVNSQLLHYLCRQLTVAFPSLPLVPLSRSRIFQCPNACLDYIAPATWPAPFFNRLSGLSIGFLKLSHCGSRLYPWPISLVISFCLRPYPRWILLVFIIVIAPSTLGGFVGLSPTLSIGKLSRGAFFGCGPIRPLSSRALLVGGHSQSIAKLPLWASPGRSESRPLSSRASLVRHYFHLIADPPLWASPGRSESRPLSSRTSLVRHYFHLIANPRLWASPGRSDSSPLSSRTSLVRHYPPF